MFTTPRTTLSKRSLRAPPENPIGRSIFSTTTRSSQNPYTKPTANNPNETEVKPRSSKGTAPQRVKKSLRTLEIEKPLVDALLTESAQKTPQVLLKSDKHAVSVLGVLPAEIAGLFSGEGCPLECFYGSLDVNSGYAIVITLTDCYVWSYKQKSSPTIYTFQMPKLNFSSQFLSTNEIIRNLPFVSIVPVAGSKEVGILACSPEGEFRYWESISYGLASSQKHRSMRIYLAEHERGTCLANCEPAGFVFGTSASNLYRISLTNSNGQPALSYSPLSRPLGVFARMGSLLGYNGGGESTSTDPSSEIVSVCAGASPEGRHSRDIYVLTNQHLQKWTISKAYPEKDITERDVLKDISAMLDSHPMFAQASDLVVDLLDVQYSREDGVIVLVSLTIDQETVSMFGLFSFELDGTSNQFVLTSQKFLKHKNTLFAGVTSKPRLALSNGGPAAFILLPECIVATTILNADFEEIIPLRNASTDRIIGFGFDDTKLWSRERAASGNVLALCTQSGILDVSLDMEKIGEMEEHDVPVKKEVELSDEQKKQAHHVKSKLEQAVFFGSHEENPLLFNLSRDADLGLDKAAVKLSEEILQSKSKYIPAIMEVKMQLQERFNRLNNIIQFIRESNLLHKLSISARYKLCWNCEKMASALDLWYYQNTLLSRGQRQPHTLLLTKAIESCLRSLGAPSQEDATRTFFRFHTSEIGLLPQHISELLRRLKVEQSGERNLLTHEANKIFLCIFKSAYAYRRDHSDAYGLCERAHEESWTSKNAYLDIIYAQYQLTEKAIKEFNRDFGAGQPDHFDMNVDGEIDATESSHALLKSLKDQLCELADVLFQVFTERIDYLKGKNDAPALAAAQEKYETVRPKVTLPLVSMDRTEVAFQLAERYQDYKTLVLLSVNLGEESQARIDYYINLFKEPFAYELYSYYLENGQLYQLMNQKDFYSGALHEFLENGGHTHISWLHDIHIGRYTQASSKLLQETVGEKENLQKKTMLSLAKLSYLASVDSTNLDSEQVQGSLEQIDDTLDLVTVHEVLQESYHSILESMDKVPKKIDDRILSISAINTGDLREAKPAMEQQYRQLVKKIMDGQVLDSESLIDVLTLPQNLDNQVDNYRIALGVYRRAKDIPQDRAEYVLRTIWRRVILRDSWEYIHKLSAHAGDDELLAALKDTALYCTLVAAHDGEYPADMYLQPAETHFHTSKEDLIARFVGMLEHQVELLIQDYQAENRQLDTSITQHNLLGFYNEIVRLIQTEMASDKSADMDMDIETD
ncbi:hypothetical protein K493DRAFT_268240 [Basidiobolus meristosporus CBS 931.73]|uniref:Nucleoporin-domain-containing protein n=1 Tax=Basidiobolus meristosporus CBS 931.73 TaxID=1314790 RepID=A0A1Y1XT69_9FUNG|nr:hypothetical protein K493DRAFT_268240 [Basidiobolus meristosporus CBS 931.73]|eukprot:ORX88494.1 hypothetical protein K493DRAFT_268240 [Basidiobolus meristosporus CBS 931.73]